MSFKDNNNNNIDDLFKSNFEDFSVPANDNVWDKINEDLAQNSLDKVFKQEMDNLEKDPSSSVWDQVKKELPLSLYLRNALNYLSKIAAVLLIAILCFIISDYYNKSNEVQLVSNAQINPAESILEITIPDEKAAFVFELEASPNEYSNKLAQEEENISELLEDVLEDDEDLAFDEDRMEQLLQPLEQLPIGGIVDDIGNSDFANAISEEDFIDEEYPDDLKIWVPIKFVEDDEIEAMISAYNNRME